MGDPKAVRKRDSVRTRHRILQAARHLFAQSSIDAVGIRDIANAAGVSHGLVQRYFGTREQMVAAIVQEEVARFVATRTPARAASTPPSDLAELRALLKTGESEFGDFARVIVRAELAGLEPGKMLASGQPTPGTLTTDLIRKLRRGSAGAPPRLDPALVSAYINASLFAFATMSPWLMSAVGLRPEEYQSRADEIHEISIQLIALAAGIPAGDERAPDRKRPNPGKARRPARAVGKRAARQP